MDHYNNGAHAPNMNEFDQLEELQNLELLKEIQPEWMSSKVEPLNPEVEITPPTWNKLELPAERGGNTGPSGGEPQPGTEQVICAMQQGGTFVPKIMTPVEGTLFTDP